MSNNSQANETLSEKPTLILGGRKNPEPMKSHCPYKFLTIAILTTMVACIILCHYLDKFLN